MDRFWPRCGNAAAGDAIFVGKQRRTSEEKARVWVNIGVALKNTGGGGEWVLHK